MKYIQFLGPGSDDYSTLESDSLSPGEGEVVVRVSAAALNYLDLAIVNGDFPAASFPLIPLCDGVGHIDSMGRNASHFAVGDRVIPHFMPKWEAGGINEDRISILRGVNSSGMLTQQTLASEASLVHVPEYLSDHEASTLSITATTAWNGVKTGNVVPGSVVVLQGTGGVSLLALQFAKTAGAFVIVTSSSDQKLERVKELGADATINYRTTRDWAQEVTRITDSYGADLIIDAGGADTLPDAIKCAAFDGVVFVIGFISGFKASVDIGEVFAKRVRIIGNNTGSLSDLREALKAMRTHRIRPVINSVSEFQDFQNAYRNQSRAESFGKNVISTL